jgi:drug/metabolite transporter (DMT)-like permease
MNKPVATLRAVPDEGDAACAAAANPSAPHEAAPASSSGASIAGLVADQPPSPRNSAQGLRFLPTRVAWLWSSASNNLRATIMTMASIVLFSVMLTNLKLIGTRVPMTEILLIRQIIVSVVIIQFFGSGWRYALRTNNFGLQVLRGLFSFGSQLTQFVALLYIPLAEVTALSFSQVIFITIGAAVILRESVNWRRWLATVIGLAGVIVMLLPTGGDGLTVFAVMALASGMLSAGVSITIRSMSHKESTITIMLYQSIILCLFYVGPAAWWWVWPTATEWWLLATIGIFGSVAQYLFTRGCQIGQASALAPLEFSRLLIAAVIGYFVFREIPSLTMLIGATIIIASTVYTVRHNV